MATHVWSGIPSVGQVKVTQPTQMWNGFGCLSPYILGCAMGEVLPRPLPARQTPMASHQIQRGQGGPKILCFTGCGCWSLFSTPVGLAVVPQDRREHEGQGEQHSSLQAPALLHADDHDEGCSMQGLKPAQGFWACPSALDETHCQHVGGNVEYSSWGRACLCVHACHL